MATRDATMEKYRDASRALLNAVERERRVQGKRQYEMSGSRAHSSQVNYCIAIKRGSAYLSTFLAFCDSLDIDVVLVARDGRILTKGE